MGALCISLATSWAVGEVFGWAHSLNKSVKDAPWFYVIYLLCLVSSGAVVLIPNAPLILITMFVQVVAVTLLPAALTFLILLLKERARTILSEMSVPQLADLFSVLPHDDKVEMMELLPKEQAERIQTILSDREVNARVLMSADYVPFPKETTVGEVLGAIRHSEWEHGSISYFYVVDKENVLEGVVGLRELVLSPDPVRLGKIMASPVVSAEEDDTQEDVVELFAKYHYRMIPVVDPRDHLFGVIHYKDIMQGLVTRAKM